MDVKKFSVKIGDDTKELSFKRANQEELLALDLEYRRIFSQCLREGIITEVEAKKIANKNGVWTKDDDNMISTIALEVNILESIVRNEDNKFDEKKIEETVDKLTKKRIEMMDLIGRLVEIKSNSAEGLAMQQKMHKFILLCCVNGNGARLFDSLGSYEKMIQEHPEVVSELFRQAYCYEFGDPDDVTGKWAEVEYRKKKLESLEKKIEEDNKTQAEDKKVEEPVAEAQEEAKPERKRKSKELVEK